MEQTSHTPDFTANELTALRQHVQRRLITRAREILQAFEDMEPPQTVQDVARHARAILSLSRLFDRLIPAREDEADLTDAVTEVLEAEAAPEVKMNRHARRRAEALGKGKHSR